jgi:stage II sporulation protein D
MSIGDKGQPLTIYGGVSRSQWDGPIHVSRNAKGWVVSGRGGPLSKVAIESNSLDIHPNSGTPVTLLHRKGSPNDYPGFMRVLQDGDVKEHSFLLLNIVPMEQYLPGVLQGELFAGWPDATYQAQAVAARSFATMQVQHRVNRAWDVTDNAATQVYIGTATDKSAIFGAQSTHGQVLSWNGGLVPGYFCSCCGGLPATGTEAVGPNPLNAISPLNGHTAPIKCGKAPVYTWSRDVSAEAVTKAFQACGRDQHNDALESIGIIHEIQHARLNQHGRAMQLRVVDTHGRRALIDTIDASSALFDLKGGPLMSGWFSAKRHGDQLKLTGRGFGHGAGLCQYGASAMGADGNTMQTIIEFYYPGVIIQTAW